MREPADMWLWRFVSRRFSGRQTVSAPPKPSLSPVLDLHGFTVQEAYQITLDYLRASSATLKEVTVITGKSGVIAREFPFWVDRLTIVSKIEPQNGGGAFRVKFRRTFSQGK